MRDCFENKGEMSYIQYRFASRIHNLQLNDVLCKEREKSVNGAERRRLNKRVEERVATLALCRSANWLWNDLGRGGSDVAGCKLADEVPLQADSRQHGNVPDFMGTDHTRDQNGAMQHQHDRA